MKIYIDANYKCHITNDGTMRQIDTAFFDGKCKPFIEGYRFVPDGETWVREDGSEFKGEMVSPWKPYDELEKTQAQWEHEQLDIITKKCDNLLQDVANLVDEVYQEDQKKLNVQE